MILRGIAATALALSVWASSAEGWFTAVALVLGGYGLLYALFSFIGSRSWLDLGLALLAAWNLLRLAL
ncbi:hypothetical protein [Pseudoxanthomonas sp. UC19_8]|uniref:hypothetical protein n=1 Tax=Pseudoxanthomonas sp. UC19_8 TaxID=3350175 RepID=UPI0036D22314